MLIMYENKPMEGGSAVLCISFKDDNKSPIVPLTLSWTLCDALGGIINNRQDEVVDTPASVTKILVYGDDLKLTDAEDDGFRLVLLDGTYDSSLGDGIPLKDQFGFYIERRVISSNPLL